MLRKMFRLTMVFLLLSMQSVFAQFKNHIQWTADGNGYFYTDNNGIEQVDIRSGIKTLIVTNKELTPPDSANALQIASFVFSNDHKKLLVFTNTARVWRYRTKGDYWVLDVSAHKLMQLGKGLPSQSLMYAKFSPNGEKVGYVSEHNLFTEDISTQKITQLTVDGTRKLINGTFDWVYEEELGCRDGFRWSPDGSKIAFWQVDGSKIRDYYMLNTTDSVYSQVVPVEYPKVGEPPSPVRIGVVSVDNKSIQWMNIEGDPQQHYLPCMEWADSNRLVVQQLDRKQQESKLIYCNATTGNSNVFYKEHDSAWIDIKSVWNDDDPTGWYWIDHGRSFIWVSEKDGWRHLYKISRDGKTESLLTNGNYDIASIKCIDEAGGNIYFMASPDNATELYLYRIKMDGKSNAVLVSSSTMKGTNNYEISPNAKFAMHSFSNYNTYPAKEWVSLPDNQPVDSKKSISATMRTDETIDVEYTKITTDDGITVDAWINKPANFDSTKKYPVVFYVYGEPAATTTDDEYGNQQNFLYNGDMSADGYFQVSVDNRGTPALKGAAWRKCIYRKVGSLDVHDIAMAAKKLLERPYFDKDRVAVWGWSGGGTSTLLLLCKYPEIFKTGIAIAALTNMLYYDNIYSERYMGLPQENMQDYINGSPVTYAKDLQGNLLYIHGSGDDNVHYSNAEALLNELIKYNKQFQFMEYPNRTHSISEGPGTGEHLVTLYTSYLKKYCPPGGK
jgi:dipeptidyl-peptidase 4